MHENFGQIEQFTSELLTLSIFPLFSHIFYRVKWENAKIKNKRRIQRDIPGNDAKSNAI